MKAAADKYVLAIDLGTSGPKSALVSTRGEVIDYEFESIDLLILPNGGAEQDPGQWWRAIINTAPLFSNFTFKLGSASARRGEVTLLA